MADLAKIQTVENDGVLASQVNGAAEQTIVFDAGYDRVLVEIENTDSTTVRARFEAGNGMAKVKGDMFKDIAQNETFIFAELESDRFKNADGKVTLKLTGTNDASFGGTIANVKLRAIYLPKAL